MQTIALQKGVQRGGGFMARAGNVEEDFAASASFF
jgi:hypothetical protein